MGSIFSFALAFSSFFILLILNVGTVKDPDLARWTARSMILLALWIEARAVANAVRLYKGGRNG